MSGPGDSQSCLNCGTQLTGQYCGQCGQRATSRFISIWELLRDAFGDLFELDSRLWRTLAPLLVRPGLLTKDYLEGRRARYMPPFRMYLVLSLLFFVVAFFDPRDELAIFYEPEPESTAEIQIPPGMSQEEVDAKLAEAREEGRHAIQELIDAGILDPEAMPEKLREQLAPADEAVAPDEGLSDDAPPGEESPDDGDEKDGINVTITGDDADDDIIVTFDDAGMLGECNLDDFDMGDSPEWLKRRMTPERLKDVCERINTAGLKGVKNAVLENIPAALIILLPIMAFVLKLLYPLSRRYYVEHLLFFVHFHAFFFLIMSLEILLTRLGDWIGFLDPAVTVVTVAASFYIPVYLFLAMRRVYGQGRAATFLKYVPLTISYLVGLTLMMIGAVLIAVFSI
jgi:hypothetical protein